MATFVPGFVSQALRDWLKLSRDAYGKAPLGADPKAQLAEQEARRGPAPRATLAEVADHIAYLVETAGIDHVGIGSDFFGGAAARGLEHVGRFPHLFAELIRRGFSERDLDQDRQPQRAEGRCARSSASASGCGRCASRRSAGSRIIRGREAPAGVGSEHRLASPLGDRRLRFARPGRAGCGAPPPPPPRLSPSSRPGGPYCEGVGGSRLAAPMSPLRAAAGSRRTASG